MEMRHLSENTGKTQTPSKQDVLKMNELPVGYMTGIVTVTTTRYASTIEGAKKRQDSHILT